jgi:pimeloyl-[acyl-carrier protein] synthase
VTAADLLRLGSDELKSDPYPAYHQLREAEPVSFHEGIGAYVLTRHADVTSMLRDPRFIKDPRYESLSSEEEQSPLQRMKSQWVLFRNPPFHTRLRAVMSSALRPGSAQRLAELVDAMAIDLVRGRQSTSRIEVIEELALPLPIMVISHLLGVSEDLHGIMKRLTADVFRTFDPQMTEEIFTAGEDAVEEFSRQFAQLLEQDVAGETLDRLRSSWAESRCSFEEVVAACVLMYAAGHETTTELIGNALLAVARAPESQAELRRIGITDSVLAELWRYDAPVQQTLRIASSPATIGGVEIPRGARVMALLGAANRDPEVFPDPDVLDFGRTNIRHVSFGDGIHYCLGAPVAQLEVGAAIRAVLDASSWFELETEKLTWRDTFSVRGVRALPLRIVAP